MSRSSQPSPQPRHEIEQLQDAFGEVAVGLTPSPVPLAAIERAGRARRRRRAAGMVIGCGLLFVPLAAVTVGVVLPEHASPGRSEVAAHPTPPDTAGTAGAVRVVAPGERVRAAAGVELWLTAEGKHWSTPETDHQFRSVVDGNVGHGRATVSLMTEPVGDRCFLSGSYGGSVDVGRVVVDTGDGEVTASVVRLAGAPDWGVWYADVPLAENLRVNGVTLYDRAGREVASLTPSRT